MSVFRSAALAVSLFAVFFTVGCDSTAAGDTSTVKEISVSIVARKVEPPADRIKVAKGQTVRITIRSDVSDVVHVHGYDKSAALMPDKPATIEFVADSDGVFEVETHVSKLQLFQLEVS